MLAFLCLLFDRGYGYFLGLHLSQPAHLTGFKETFYSSPLVTLLCLPASSTLSSSVKDLKS